MKWTGILKITFRLPSANIHENVDLKLNSNFKIKIGSVREKTGNWGYKKSMQFVDSENIN